MTGRGNPSRPVPRALAPKGAAQRPGTGVLLVGSTVAGSTVETTSQQPSHIGGNLEQHTPPLAHHQTTHFQQHHPSPHQQHHLLQHQPHSSLHGINAFHNTHTLEVGSPSIHPTTTIPQASASSSTAGYVWATDTSNSQTPQPPNPVMDIPKMKRNCVSNACVHCRKKRSKCDGESPCAKCVSSGKEAECRYDVENDHRRKGALRRRNEELEHELKMKEAHMAKILKALRNADDDSVKKIVKRIKREAKLEDIANSLDREESVEPESFDLAMPGTAEQLQNRTFAVPKSRKNAPSISEARQQERTSLSPISDQMNEYSTRQVRPSSWTKVTDDDEFVEHLVGLFFTWDQPMFMSIPESRFRYDFERGEKTYCSALIVNAICAVGCHFSERPEAYENGEMRVEARGRHFRDEAVRLMEQLEDKDKVADLVTIQAIFILSYGMSVAYSDAKGYLHFTVLQRLVNKQAFQNVFEEDPLSREFKGDREDFEWLFWAFYITDASWCSGYMTKPAVPEFPLPNLPNCQREIEECPWYPYDGNGPYDRSKAVLELQRIISPMATGHARIKLFCLLHDIDTFLYARGSVMTAKGVLEMYMRLKHWKRDLPPEFSTINDDTAPHTLVMHMMHCCLYLILLKPFTQLRVRRQNPRTPTPLSLATEICKDLLEVFRIYHRKYNIRRVPSMATQYLMFFLQIRQMSFPAPDAISDFREVFALVTELAQVYPVVKIAILSLQDTEAMNLQEEEVNTVGLASMLESLNVEDEQELHNAKKTSRYYEKLVKETKSILEDNFEVNWEIQSEELLNEAKVVPGVVKQKLDFLLN